MTEQTIIPPTGPAFERGAVDLTSGSVLLRFVAMMIDWGIVFGILMIGIVPLLILSWLGSFVVAPLLAALGLTLAPSFMMLLVFMHWIYFATMESGTRGATYGKRLMGLRVVDDRGRGLSFARASLRYVAKLASAAPLMIGFVMALFTARKQALHDLIAETLVVRA